ncbi:MAG: ABC transporter permease [Anaerolineae bacterium]|nr:ABC transporter permease [Phycisphaerae bacterium]
MGIPIRYNLRNLGERKATTFMTALGIGLTVAVLVTSIAMTYGMSAVFAGSGHPLQVLVLRKGTDAELNSQLKEEAFQIVKQLPGIAQSKDGEQMASPEGITIVNLPSQENPNGMNVTVRGMLPVGVKMREGAKLKQGRWSEPGKREIVVGDGIATRYPAARVGQSIRFGRGEWQVVGVFVDGESAANSEIWADLNQLRGDFESQGGSNSVLVRLQSDAAIPEFKKAIAGDQRLGADTYEEREYYKNLTKSSSGVMLQFIGFFVSVVMAVGAGFAATNTMYAAVARRSKEIGTLRALGFSRFSILSSFVFESICLALLGGIVGVLIALPLNNLSAGIGNWQTFSEMAFRFKIDYRAILGGLLFAVLIGAVGGFLPAFSAARKGIVQAMRDT